MNGSKFLLGIALLVALLTFARPPTMSTMSALSAASADPISGKASLLGATSAAVPLYADDFSDPDSSWPQGDNDTSLTAIVGGEYRMMVKKPETISWVIGTPFFADIDAEVKVRYQGADTDKAYGLVFGAKDTTNFYDFEVDPVDGTYLLRSRAAGAWHGIVDWTASPAIQRNSAANVLRVIRRGADIALYVNGTRLVKVSDPKIAAGRIGLLVANYATTGGADVYFDDVRIFHARDRELALQLFVPRIDQQPSAPAPIATAVPPPSSGPGIFGRVTVYAEAAVAMTVTLNQYDDTTNPAQLIATTFTDNDGRYRFTNVPTLPTSKIYFVRFGPNDSNPQLVFAWYGPDITPYARGTDQAGGDFDIGDLILDTPTGEQAVKPPVTFRWFPRPVYDTYRVRIFDPSGTAIWTTNDVGHVSAVAINLPDGAVYDKTYGWMVRAYLSASSFGDAHFYSPFKFSRTSMASTGAPGRAGDTLDMLQAPLLGLGELGARNVEVKESFASRNLMDSAKTLERHR